MFQRRCVIMYRVPPVLWAIDRGHSVSMKQLIQEGISRDLPTCYRYRNNVLSRTTTHVEEQIRPYQSRRGEGPSRPCSHALIKTTLAAFRIANVLITSVGLCTLHPNRAHNTAHPSKVVTDGEHRRQANYNHHALCANVETVNDNIRTDKAAAANKCRY